MKQFGIYKARQLDVIPLRKRRFYEKDWFVIMLAIGIASSIFSFAFYLGVGSVMNECDVGAGTWLVIIAHHGDEIECRRSRDIQHESFRHPGKTA
jgi:hypothetical protein